MLPFVRFERSPLTPRSLTTSAVDTFLQLARLLLVIALLLLMALSAIHQVRACEGQVAHVAKSAAGAEMTLLATRQDRRGHDDVAC